jgi:hypothetical protein
MKGRDDDFEGNLRNVRSKLKQGTACSVHTVGRCRCCEWVGHQGRGRVCLQSTRPWISVGCRAPHARVPVLPQFADYSMVSGVREFRADICQYCRKCVWKKVWSLMKNTVESNQRESLRAIMTGAVHGSWIPGLPAVKM